jgi:serine/threonine protein kinase
MAFTVPVTAGSRFGPYEVVSSLGAGGMGEVYRARDERLGRMVAIKVLASDSHGDPEFRERLRREARALSRLNHPNICAVYDVGTEGDRDYFVMELLEGETLATRLERGPLPIERVLDVALQIAAALETSHRMGLVHRDLKPANIMVTTSGVKLLDFGLVRFAPSAAQSSRETISDALTTQGTLLGTVQYMSPEQVEGREADARSDLFSVGAVIYEMITGRRAFSGDTQASLIGAILKDDAPSLLAVQPAVPSDLDRLIHSCLVKNPDDRWQSAHDLRLELGWIADKLRRPDATSPVRRSPRGWMAVAVISAAVAAVLLGRELRRVPVERPAIRSMLPPPENSQYISVGTHAGPAVLAPDGRRVAFLATSHDARLRLSIRSLDSLVTQSLNGTEGASYPFWSADGESLGFFADGKLKTITIASGRVTTLADAQYGAGGAWNSDGTIVFAPGLSGGLQRVPSAGGTPHPATALTADRGETTHRWPVFLPDGRGFLYTVGQAKSGGWKIKVGSLDSDRAEDLIEDASNALYANGALIFTRSGTLLAQPVDERSLRTSGSPVQLAENVLHDIALGRAVFSASQTGSLIYQVGSAATGSRLVWLDRTGKELGVVEDTCFCIWPRLSPDEQRVAVAITDARTGNRDIWTYELAERLRSRLTFEEAREHNPEWTPDGSRIVFNSTRGGVRDLYWMNARGRGP